MLVCSSLWIQLVFLLFAWFPLSSLCILVCFLWLGRGFRRILLCVLWLSHCFNDVPVFCDCLVVTVIGFSFGFSFCFLVGLGFCDSLAYHFFHLLLWFILSKLLPFFLRSSGCSKRLVGVPVYLCGCLLLPLLAFSLGFFFPILDS